MKEVEALGRALADAEAKCTYAVAAFRLLLLTGCRLGEIQTLRWKHVHLDEGELRLPDSKTGAKVVHLGTAAIVLLRSLPRIDDNPFVIVGTKPGAHLTDLQRPWRRIRKAAGLGQTRIHDLRHTFASGGLAVGESLPIIGKLLGHTQVQTTARYAHLAADPLKARQRTGLPAALPPPCSPLPRQTAPMGKRSGAYLSNRPHRDGAEGDSTKTAALTGFGHLR